VELYFTPPTHLDGARPNNMHSGAILDWLLEAGASREPCTRYPPQPNVRWADLGGDFAQQRNSLLHFLFNVLKLSYWSIMFLFACRSNRGVEKTTWRGALWSALLNKYHSGEQKKNEMGRACGTYGGERCIQGFVGETWVKLTTWKT